MASPTILLGEDAPRERHFNDAAGSGGQFINLSVLQNTRDNLRQSVMDMLNLNASLTAISDNLDAQTNCPLARMVWQGLPAT